MIMLRPKTPTSANKQFQRGMIHGEVPRCKLCILTDYMTEIFRIATAILHPSHFLASDR